MSPTPASSSSSQQSLRIGDQSDLEFELFGLATELYNIGTTAMADSNGDHNHEGPGALLPMQILVDIDSSRNPMNGDRKIAVVEEHAAPGPSRHVRLTNNDGKAPSRVAEAQVRDWGSKLQDLQKKLIARRRLRVEEREQMEATPDVKRNGRKETTAVVSGGKATFEGADNDGDDDDASRTRPHAEIHAPRPALRAPAPHPSLDIPPTAANPRGVNVSRAQSGVDDKFDPDTRTVSKRNTKGTASKTTGISIGLVERLADGEGQPNDASFECGDCENNHRKPEKPRYQGERAGDAKWIEEQRCIACAKDGVEICIGTGCTICFWCNVKHIGCSHAKKGSTNGSKKGKERKTSPELPATDEVSPPPRRSERSGTKRQLIIIESDEESEEGTDDEKQGPSKRRKLQLAPVRDASEAALNTPENLAQPLRDHIALPMAASSARVKPVVQKCLEQADRPIYVGPTSIQDAVSRLGICQRIHADLTNQHRHAITAIDEHYRYAVEMNQDTLRRLIEWMSMRAYGS